MKSAKYAIAGKLIYLNIQTTCPRNSITPLHFCFDHNSEMEGRREMSNVLN
jgi:hypothetical protein